MTRIATFDRDIRVATQELSLDAISGELARFAKAGLKQAIASGEASPQFQRFVNGREGAPEDSVKAPGPILYLFTNWPLIINEALASLIKNSPRKTGAFQSSFVVIAGGMRVTSFEAIDPDAEVIITNSRPYVRKIQVGAMKKMSVPPKIFEKARSAVVSRFGRALIDAEVTFLRLPAGIHPDIPYILKGRQKVRAASPTMKSSAFRAGRSTLSRRKDSEAGQPLTYPALILNLRDL